MTERDGGQAMKTAREVAHEIFSPTWEHTPKELALYDAVVEAINAARREGAEWMRKQAARVPVEMVVGGRAWTHDQEVAAEALLAAEKSIRALPLLKPPAEAP